MRLFPVIRNLPPTYLEGIGAVCAQWSLLERELALVSFMLLGVGPKEGRVAVRSPRAVERLIMIRQLMSLKKLEVKDIDLDAMATSLSKMEPLRDQVAHGIFMRGENDSQIFLQNLSGNWKPNPKEPKVSRRIKPEGVEITAADLKELGNLISQCTAAVRQLGLELERGLGSSEQKFQQQSEQDRPQDDPNSDTNEPRLQSSSG